MFNLKKETIKKNIFLSLSVIFAFMFIAGLMCAIMGDSSPVKFIINGSPIKIIVPPFCAFFISFAFYRSSKIKIKENTK